MCVVRFFLLNICKTIIAQEITKQPRHLTDWWNREKRDREREKKRKRKRDDEHDRLATTLLTIDYQKKQRTDDTHSITRKKTMYQFPHYTDALKQFPSAALSAYFAGAANGGNSMIPNAAHHPFAAAAAAAAAAAVVSHTNPFSIDNILAARPRLPMPLSSYYGPTAANTVQAAADFYCKYNLMNKIKGVKAKTLPFFLYLLMINVFNC